MTVRRTVRAAAVLAAAAVFVTACGNGDDGDDLAGVDQADEAGAGDSEDAEDPESDEEEDEEDEEEEPADGEPVFDFPDNFEVVVDDDLTGDEERDELLRDHAYALKAMNEGYVQQGGTDNFSRYWTAPIDSDYLYDFDRYAEENYTVVGVDHFYSREIVRMEGGYAAIEFCEDMRDGHTEEVETGERIESDASGDDGEFGDFLDHRMELKRGDEGDWQVTHSAWSRDSEECAQKVNE